jgi:hypothetical protein
LRIVNVDGIRARRMLHLPDTPLGNVLARPALFAQYLRMLFRIDYPVHIGVFVDEK